MNQKAHREKKTSQPSSPMTPYDPPFGHKCPTRPQQSLLKSTYWANHANPWSLLTQILRPSTTLLFDFFSQDNNSAHFTHFLTFTFPSATNSIHPNLDIPNAIIITPINYFTELTNIIFYNTWQHSTNIACHFKSLQIIQIITFRRFLFNGAYNKREDHIHSTNTTHPLMRGLYMPQCYSVSSPSQLHPSHSRILSYTNTQSRPRLCVLHNTTSHWFISHSTSTTTLCMMCFCSAQSTPLSHNIMSSSESPGLLKSNPLSCWIHHVTSYKCAFYLSPTPSWSKTVGFALNMRKKWATIPHAICFAWFIAHPPNNRGWPRAKY